MMIFACYPDYGKAPPEYVVNVIDVLATFPEWVMVKLCNLREGIPAKCKFLPAIAEIVQMGEAFVQAREFMEEADRIRRAEEKKAEQHRAWWNSRLEALKKAKLKYPNAFLAADGSLMQPAEIKG